MKNTDFFVVKKVYCIVLWILCACMIACGSESDDPASGDSDKPPIDNDAGDASDDSESDPLGSDSSADSEMDASDEDDTTDSEGMEHSFPDWTFDTDWDGFVHAFGDVSFTHDADIGALIFDGELAPSEESSFGKELHAVDWRGATAVDIVLGTRQLGAGSWRFEIDTSYAWSPCIVFFEQPETPEWTTVTIDLQVECGDGLMLEMTQAIFLGVVAAVDAEGFEPIDVAVDRITVR
jgi:hypothetical protein